MTQFRLHERLQSLFEGCYLHWKCRRGAGHPRGIDRLGTYLARAAAPFFPDILWRVTDQSADRFQLPQYDSPTLYLTIDDGPTASTTPAILEVLRQFRASATFFVVGQNVRKEPRLLREMAGAGHTIGNHTETHRDAWTSLFGDVADDLVRTDELLGELLGDLPRWVRPPHGHFTAKMRAWCHERRQHLVLWDVLPADFSPRTTPAETVTFVRRFARTGSIVVLHDSDHLARRTPQALAAILAGFSDAGWRFAALPSNTSAQLQRRSA